MKTLMLHAASFETCSAHYYFHRDSDFANKLADLGYRLVLSTQSNPLECDRILFVEAYSVGMHRFRLRSRIKHYVKAMLGRTQYDLYGELRVANMLDKLALIVIETPLVLPENYSRKLHSLFPIVFTWNDDLVDGRHILKYCLAQSAKWPEIKRVPYRDKKLLVDISSNKHAKHPLELYSARRKAIRYFENTLPNDFDLYGFGWNTPATTSQKLFKFLTPCYRSYRGVVDNKVDILPGYRFALCYENASLPGNIDEKIFDCMRSDCVPIYLGAPNIKDYVDADAFINYRDFTNLEELKCYIVGVTEAEYRCYREAIRAYLAGPRFARFLVSSFAETIVKGLESVNNSWPR